MLSRLTLPKAPPITGRHWLDSAPVTAEMLVGRPALVLFWAASCEASWVRIRQLERLRARHGDQLAVVAVHSPRFDYERDVGVLRATIEQRSIDVPVIHDPDLETWARYGPTGRPTIAVVDADGRAQGAILGLDEPGTSPLDEIAALHARLARPGLVPLPDHPSVTRSAPPLHRLQAPTSLARLTDGTVAVLDPAAGRIVVLELSPHRAAAEVRTTFSGVDGAGSIAVRRGRSLVISLPDRGTVESIDLETKQRTILADELRRPAGLVEDVDGSLVVCDAGADAIVRISPEGVGAIADEVSQPLDVIRLPTGLLFTEASTGAVRLLTDDGKVRTINSGGRAGILDGPAHKAMFQRPTGLATLDGGRVAIADHGNSRIRLFGNRRVATVPVTGLAHPEGVLYLGHERLLCSDTANSRLVIVDLAAHTVDEVAVQGLPL